METTTFNFKEIARLLAGSAAAYIGYQDGNKYLLIAGGCQAAPVITDLLDIDDSETIENIAKYASHGGLVYIAVDMANKYFKQQDKRPVVMIAGVATMAYAFDELTGFFTSDEDDENNDPVA